MHTNCKHSHGVQVHKTIKAIITDSFINFLCIILFTKSLQLKYP